MKKTICTLITSLMVGCSTQMKRDIYEVDSFKLICDSEQGINSSYQNYTLNQLPNNRVAGFHVRKQIYVRYTTQKDIKGERLPDFYTLGHELWHLIKGEYHK